MFDNIVLRNSDQGNVTLGAIAEALLFYRNTRLIVVPRRFVWNLTARIHRSGARWGLWATRQSELSTNPPGGAFC